MKPIEIIVSTYIFVGALHGLFGLSGEFSPATWMVKCLFWPYLYL